MAAKVIGGILVTLGVLVCLITLVPIIGLSWQMWNGHTPDMIGGSDGFFDFSARQFLGVCGAVLLVGLGLLGVGVQFLFRSGRQE